METLERKTEVLASRVARVRTRRAAASGQAGGRVASETARHAAAAFAELRRFFRSSSQLQKALSWSAPTLRSWIGEHGPLRPRAHSVERVLLLVELASAAKKWVSDPWQVGDWLLEPQPNLGGVSPTQVVDVLGAEGVHKMIDSMAVIAPRERVSSDPVDLNEDALRATLDRLGAPTIADIEPSGEVDLSDFE